MLFTSNDIRDFGRMMESYRRERNGQRAAEALLRLPETLRRESRTPEDRNRISMRELFENLVPDGREALRMLREGRGGGGVFMESSGQMQTALFSNVLGQITYADVLDSHDMTGFFGRELHTTRSAVTQQREMIPGVVMLGDAASKIGEGEEYPRVTFGEEFITQPRKEKDGFMVDITAELIWEDNIGVVRDLTTKGSQAIEINFDNELMRNALGLSTSYSRNGGDPQATYANTHTNGDFDNLLAGNALQDYTNVDAVFQLFEAMRDFNTGEPIMLSNTLDVIYPTELHMAVNRVFNATEVQQGAIDATTPRTISANPISTAGKTFRFHTSNRVKFLTGSASTWFMGDFREAFDYREVWPTQVLVENENSSGGWDRDVVMRMKVRRKGAAGVRSPQHAIKCTA